jgi:Leucine-rich repeat (LRR) protein
LKYFAFILIILICFISCREIALSRIAKSNEATTVLDLSNAQLKEIPDKVFNNKRLKKLYLFNNKLDSLDERIGDLIDLEELYLGKNQLKFLPQSLENCSKLKKLTLHYNQFEQLPDVIFKLKNLEQLWLFRNQLETLPEAIGQLQQLKFLQLGFNNLTKLPDSLYVLSNLQSLFLDRNQILEISSKLIHLKKLKELNVSHAGPLLNLPDELCEMRFLEDFTVSKEIVIPSCVFARQTTRLRIKFED